MSEDSEDRFLDRLRGGRGKSMATSALGRLGRTARVALRTGASVLTSKGGSGLAAADPKVIEELVLTVGELKGMAMKMGQVLSYVDDSLPPETRKLLANLQRWSPQTPFEAVAATIREDLGDRAEALLATMARQPVASASIGQVHRATLESGLEVAVKVRHPGIEKAIQADFRTAIPSATLGRLFVPGADLREIMQEAREGFTSECDYHREARSQERFCEIVADHPHLRIPEPHLEQCGPRVLTTTWQDGRSFEELLASDPSQERRNAIGEALYEFYVGSLYRHGLFNADPHPGNLLFQDDGGVVILDHGCVREFEPDTVTQLAELSAAVRDDERERICAALQALGVKSPRKDKSYQATRDMLRSFYNPILKPGAHPISAESRFETRSVISAKMRILRMHIPGKLLFLFRIRFGLYALLTQLRAIVDWQALEERLGSAR